MTDRYTEFVKQAYEAQQAREGEAYKTATFDLTSLDQQLAELSRQRENVVAALEAMDDAIEAAKEALDAYFAGRDEDADEPTESDDGLFEDADLPSIEDVRGILNSEPHQVEEDEYASAKANGALS